MAKDRIVKLRAWRFTAIPFVLALALIICTSCKGDTGSDVEGPAKWGEARWGQDEWNE